MGIKKIKRYGWCPDHPDVRDHKLMLPEHVALAPLPSSVDLRPQTAAIRDQGELGSCTANAIAAAVDFEIKKLGKQVLNPSRLFIYYLEREMEGTVKSDSGAQIRDGIKAVAKYGVVPEAMWPYDVGKFADNPPSACYAVAKQHVVEKYVSVPGNLASLKGCLAAGWPFVFGFTVYDAFESAEVAKTGILTLPTAAENMVGGHAVLGVGYDDVDQCILVQNSWGSDWGLGGFFKMPYAYISNPNLADDMWSIRLVED